MKEGNMMNENNLPKLQKIAYSISKSKGFHSHGDYLRRAQEPPEGRTNLDPLTPIDQAVRELYNRIYLDYLGNRVMHVVGEVSEAHEHLRNGLAPQEVVYVDGKPDGFGVELADVVIRALDLAEELGIDLTALINLKLGFNKNRPHMHGKKS